MLLPLAYSFVLCLALLWQHGRKFLCNNDGGSQFSLFKNNTLVAVVCGRGIFLFCDTDLIVDSGGLLAAACSVRRSSEEF